VEIVAKELNCFEKFLLVSKGIGFVTLRGYNGSVKRLVKHLQTLTPTHGQIIDYVAKMYEKSYSYSHIVNTSLAIEWYMTFINNPIKLGRPKKPRHIIKDTLTEAEVTMLIHSAKNIREKAIITLLAYSGIRNKELCRMKVNEINFGDNTLMVLEGKGRKDRRINISGDCTRILIEYLNSFPRKENDYLFTTLRLNHRYDQNDLRKLVHVLARRAKLNKRVYPHLLRHSLATNLLKRGANLYLIKEQLGHVFLETTMVYLRSFPQRIQNEYNLYIPSYI